MVRVLFFCRGIDWNRTSDTRIFSPLLYHLSYDAISENGGAKIKLFFKTQIFFIRNCSHTGGLPCNGIRHH